MRTDDIFKTLTMVTFCGIEMTERAAFIILSVLTLIFAIIGIVGQIIMSIGDDKDKIDMSICGGYMTVIGLGGFIVFSLLAGCFK